MQPMLEDHLTDDQIRTYDDVIWPEKIFSRSIEVKAYQSCLQLVYRSLSKSTWPCSEMLPNSRPTASWEPPVFKSPVICKYLKAEGRALHEKKR